MKKLLLFLLIAPSLVYAKTEYCLDESIGGCYTLNETGLSFVKDHGKYGYNSTTTGATRGVAGVFGSAFTFNGSTSQLRFGTAANLKPATLPISFVAWSKLAATGSRRMIIGNEGRLNSNGQVSGAWLIINSSNRIECGYGDNTGSGSTAYRIKTGTTAMSSGTWYHLACNIRGATDMDLFVNGVDDGGSYTGTGGAMVYRGAGGDDPHIGAESFGTAFYNGTLDEVAQFNRSLTSTEVADIRDNGLSGGQFNTGGSTVNFGGATFNL